MNNLAPTCPTIRVSPFTQDIIDLIHSIPRAHDLKSAIHTINIINHVITQITRGAPQINNVYLPRAPSLTLKASDNNPKYGRENWVEVDRTYETRHVVNPDDREQKIPIKVLTQVMFANANTAFELEYDGVK